MFSRQPLVQPLNLAARSSFAGAQDCIIVLCRVESVQDVCDSSFALGDLQRMTRFWSESEINLEFEIAGYVSRRHLDSLFPKPWLRNFFPVTI